MLPTARGRLRAQNTPHRHRGNRHRASPDRRR